MSAYVIQRVLLMFLTLLGMSVIIFVLLRLVPGNIVDIMFDSAGFVDPSEKATIEKELGLDLPIYQQYFDWISALLVGDLGFSFVSEMPAIDEIGPRIPITAKLVANMITSVGTDRVLTLDLHAEQIQGFFDIPMDNVYASPVLLGDIWKHEYSDLIVVSPDVGGVVRARAIAKRLDESDLAIIDKRRPKANEAQVMNIIGDVKGKTCILLHVS